MSISPGFTVAEIREFVHEYQRVPHGQKGVGSDYAGSDDAGPDDAGSDYEGSDYAGSDDAGSDYVEPDETGAGASDG